jgi:porin
MAVQVEVSLRPNPANELFLKLGFGADNGLNPVSPWVLVPWAADLEDNVKDINSSGRDYLLSAWYKHRFAFDDDRVLGASFGILDSTDYLDGNTYANDEYTQFMNEAFVNSGSYGLPSYAPGAGLEWTSGPWSLNAVGLNLAENDDGNNFNFWGVQAGYQLDTALGTGNYRLIFAGTSSDFLDPEGAKQERRRDYKALYSAGLVFNGNARGREADTVGVAYAYLDDGNLDIEHSQVVEADHRIGINDHLGRAADVQYLDDDLAKADPDQENPGGWVFGVRLTAEF